MKAAEEKKLLEQIARLETENSNLRMEIKSLTAMGKEKEYIPYPVYPTYPEPYYPIYPEPYYPNSPCHPWQVTYIM